MLFLLPVSRHVKLYQRFLPLKVCGNEADSGADMTAQLENGRGYIGGEARQGAAFRVERLTFGINLHPVSTLQLLV